MPLRLKQAIKENGEVRKALRRRIEDNNHLDLSQREIDSRLTQFLTRDRRDTLPQLIPGGLIDSNSWRNFIKDSKFYISALSSRTSTLEEEIQNTVDETYGSLDDIQNEVLALDSNITEEEIKVFQHYDTVHHNAFVRSIDFGLGANNRDWFVDYKTKLPFLTDNISAVIPGTGLVSPIASRTKVVITDAQLVGEETDVGDTRQPIISNDPRNLLIKDKIFRHVIMRREFDRTSRLYKREPSRVTLLLTFSNIQLLNALTIKPVGQSVVHLDKLSYINSAGEEIDLNDFTINNETNITVLFEPIRSKYIKVSFVQYASVSKTEYLNRDYKVKAINDILRGVGFEQTLPESTESMQGRVHDFSLKDITASLISYRELGSFRSQPIKVKHPLGFTLNSRVDAIRVNNTNIYDSLYTLPEGTVLDEYYAGVDFRDGNDNVLIRDLIPVPDSYPLQREFIPLIGGQSRLKLYPDLRWNLDAIQIADITHGNSVTFNGENINVGVMNTVSPHGLTVGEEITINAWGPKEHPINAEHRAYVLDEDTILIARQAGDYTYTLNDKPNIYIYNIATAIDSPINVYENSTLIEIGNRYQISLDNGNTFYSTWPTGVEYSRALRLARSGRFIIKVSNSRLDKNYLVTYKPLNGQYLGDTKLVRLKNGSAVFNKKLRDSSGTISTVIIQRAETSNPYLTSITQFYDLKVREDVS
jgi:hypothetical protein